GNSGSLNDTWALNVETRTWSKLATTGPTPPTRFAFDAVYDPAGHQMVIYSGQGSGFFNDTWTLNLNTLEWRDVSPASNAARPKARYGSASIFDPVSRSLVQFAGFTSESGRFQDTQSFSLAGNTWTDWTPGGSKPQVRCLLTAAFDRANRRMIIYGGQRSGALDDIWSFDLASRTWTNLTPAQRPAGRWFASSFIDKDGRFFIFGGFTSSGNSNELWSFDFSNNQWSKVELANPPSARNGAMSVFIEAENRLIVFGGNSNSGVMNDVWELRQNTPASPTTVATVSAASFDGASLATESIVAAFGSGLATATQVATATPLPTTLAGTSLRIKDSAGSERSAPLFFVSPTQVNFQIPAGTTAGAASLTLTGGDSATAAGTLTIANVAPSLFSANASGQGLAAAVALRIKNGVQTFEPIARFDNAQNRFVAVPIDLGAENEQVFLLLYGTGVRYRSGLSAVNVTIGGTDAQVTYAGAQNDLVGLDQINVGLPRSLAGRGDLEVVLTADGKTANRVQVRIM
ncbi:MAG: Kelch repeat-containing protein, partial [Blastocatellia bacterium]